MKFDDWLVTVGDFGTAQRRLFVLLSLPGIFYAIISSLVVVFLFAIPQHRCAVSEITKDTFEVQSDPHAFIINSSIPITFGNHGEVKYSSCDIVVSLNDTYSESDNVTTPCNSWVYDKTVYTSTVSQQFDFVCSRKSYSTHAKSVAMAGKLLGVLVTGFLSDRFGRRKVILASAFLGVLLSICLTWVPSVYIMFPVVFFMAASITTVYHTCFVYSMEIIGPSRRMLTGVAMNLFWSAGNMIVALAAFLLRDWQTRQLVLTVPGILLGLLYFLPESPRWLLRRGKKNEAHEVMLKIANQNKVKFASDTSSEMTCDEKEEVWELYKSKIMIRRLFLVCFNWFAIGMCYYGLSMNLTNLSGNIYLNFLIFAIVEASAFTICVFIIKRIQRRRLLCGSMLVAGISCITAFIPFFVTSSPEKWIVNILACLGNTCVSAAFAVVFVFTAELMPTTSRNFGIGMGSVFSRLGSVLSPYINDLTLHITGRYSQILPMLLFGGITILSGLLTLLLPETDNKRLPETIEDAEKLGVLSYDDNIERENDEHQEKYRKNAHRADILGSQKRLEPTPYSGEIHA